LCISWTNKRFDNIKMHGATVKTFWSSYIIYEYKAFYTVVALFCRKHHEAFSCFFFTCLHEKFLCFYLVYISYLNTLSWNQPLIASSEHLLYSTLQTFDFPFLSHYTSILTHSNCMRTAARSLHEICTWKQNWIFLI
jgi:hypothetical protein